MRIYYELDLSDFDAWGGGEELLEKIREADKESEFENYLEENYPDGMTEEDLNDLLRYEEDEIFKALGMEEDEEETEDVDNYVVVGSEYRVIKDSAHYNCGDIVVPLEDDDYPFCVLVETFNQYGMNLNMFDYPSSEYMPISFENLEEV